MKQTPGNVDLQSQGRTRTDRQVRKHTYTEGTHTDASAMFFGLPDKTGRYVHLQPVADIKVGKGEQRPLAAMGSENSWQKYWTKDKIHFILIRKPLFCMSLSFLMKTTRTR